MKKKAIEKIPYLKLPSVICKKRCEICRGDGS